MWASDANRGALKPHPASLTLAKKHQMAIEERQSGGEIRPGPGAFTGSSCYFNSFGEERWRRALSKVTRTVPGCK